MSGQSRADLNLPSYDPAVFEDLVTGDRIPRHAFLDQPDHSLGRQGAAIRADDPESVLILIQRGLAYRASTLPDGRPTCYCRAISAGLKWSPSGAFIRS